MVVGPFKDSCFSLIGSKKINLLTKNIVICKFWNILISNKSYSVN